MLARHDLARNAERPPGRVERVRKPLARVQRYNIAPSQQVPVARLEQGKPVVRDVRWGLTRPWTKDKKVTYLTINARVEGLTANHPFRQAWRHEQRRLVLALG